MPPLSDRASRDNGDVKGLSESYKAKATLGNQPFRGLRARHVNIVSVGTWEIHWGRHGSRMIIQERQFQDASNSSVGSQIDS